LPFEHPSYTTIVVVLAISIIILASIARFLTIYVHVLLIRLAFAFEDPLVTFCQETFSRFFRNLVTSFVFVLATAHAQTTSVSTILKHISRVADALVPHCPFGTFIVFVKAGWRWWCGTWSRHDWFADNTTTKTTRVSTILIHISWIGNAFILGCPIGTFRSRTFSRFRKISTSVVCIQAGKGPWTTSRRW